MKLILIRHGLTDWVEEGRYQGRTDIPLNHRGRLQARAAAKALRRVRPFAVFASGMARAVETAKPIASICRKKVLIDERLNEVSFGAWEGYRFADIRKRYAKDVRAWYAARWTSRPTGGESLRSVSKRVDSFLAALLKRYGRRRGSCVVVAHGGTIRLILFRLLHLSVQLFWRLSVDPASISVVEVSPTHAGLSVLNAQMHLNGLKQGGF